MLSLIHRWVFGVKVYVPTELGLLGHGIAECKRCHNCLRTGFVLTLMSHLAAEHNMHENKAIDTAVHMIELQHAARVAMRCK